jgi:hypothetical protein
MYITRGNLLPGLDKWQFFSTVGRTKVKSVRFVIFGDQYYFIGAFKT